MQLGHTIHHPYLQAPINADVARPPQLSSSNQTSKLEVDMNVVYLAPAAPSSVHPGKRRLDRHQ